jgi:hypothetical protein
MYGDKAYRSARAELLRMGEMQPIPKKFISPPPTALIRVADQGRRVARGSGRQNVKSVAPFPLLQ